MCRQTARLRGGGGGLGRGGAGGGVILSVPDDWDMLLEVLMPTLYKHPCSVSVPLIPSRFPHLSDLSKNLMLCQNAVLGMGQAGRLV